MAAVAGLVAAFAAPSPTGRPIVDAVYLAVGVGAVSYAGAWAPWWLAAAAATIAAATALDLALVALAVGAGALAVWCGRQRRPPPEWQALSVGVTMNVLARSELGGFLGCSALIAVTVGVVVFFVGIDHRPRVERHLAWATAALLVVATAVVTTAYLSAAVDARPVLHNGQSALETAIGLLGEGEQRASADQFAAAADLLDAGVDGLRGPLAGGAGVVPVLAQHHAVAPDLAATAADASRRLAAALAPSDGGVDCAAADAALADLARAVEAARSEWLIPEIAEEVDSMADHLVLLDQAGGAC